jgi:hypothetical protein
MTCVSRRSGCEGWGRAKRRRQKEEDRNHGSIADSHAELGHICSLIGYPHSAVQVVGIALSMRFWKGHRIVPLLTIIVRSPVLRRSAQCDVSSMWLPSVL